MFSLRVLLFFLSVFFGIQTLSWAGDSLTVVVDVSPVAQLIKKIGEDRVDVSLMIPDGVNPHTFKPTPSQMVEMESAQLFLNVGMPFVENYLIPKIRETKSKVKILNITDGIIFLPFKSKVFDEKFYLKNGNLFKNSMDPHVWIEPCRAIAIVDNLTKVLGWMDPEGTIFYKSNIIFFKNYLLKIDEKIQKLLKPYRGKEFFVLHPFMGYFAQVYGLKQIFIKAGDREFGAKYLAKLVLYSNSRKIRIMFMESDFLSDFFKGLAKNMNVSLIILNPLSPYYPDNLENAINAFVLRLKEKPCG